MPTAARRADPRRDTVPVEGVRETRQTPRLREVHPDEVKGDPVFGDRDHVDGGRESSRRGSREVGQEAVEPRPELVAVVHPTHEVGLRQGRRQEVPTERFGGDGGIPVVGEALDFAGDVLGRHSRVDAADDGGLVDEAERPDEHPVAVDRGVPVVAAVEHRVACRGAVGESTDRA
ncbi:hypothetical protein JCM17092_11270 [Haloplanus litoreus]